MELNTGSVFITGGGSLLIGGILGAVARNYFKILAFILGSEIAFITYLQHLNLINIRWSNIQLVLDSMISLLQTFSIPEKAPDGSVTRASLLLSGLTIGFVIGFKFG